MDGWRVFGLVGTLATVLFAAAYARWIDRDDLRQSRALMTQQMEQIKRGEINCLVQPDPRLIDELLADTACMAKIRELDLGGDLSDERLGRLRELPNLNCIVLIFARDPDVFLERLQGMAAVEQLTFEWTSPSRRGAECISKFPKLRSLCLPLASEKIDDLHAIEKHPSLENLVFTRMVRCDKRLLPFLQSLPRTLQRAN